MAGRPVDLVDVNEALPSDDPELVLLVPEDDVRDPEVSIVVPALNEEITIEEFVRWCHEGLADAGCRYELRPPVDRRVPAFAGVSPLPCSA
jgi:hypothetical protein